VAPRKFSPICGQFSSPQRLAKGSDLESRVSAEGIGCSARFGAKSERAAFTSAVNQSASYAPKVVTEVSWQAHQTSLSPRPSPWVTT
jgi:hypothetical protein